MFLLLFIDYNSISRTRELCNPLQQCLMFVQTSTMADWSRFDPERANKKKKWEKRIWKHGHIHRKGLNVHVIQWCGIQNALGTCRCEKILLNFINNILWFMSDFINGILYVWATKRKTGEEERKRERKWLNVDPATYDAFTITLFHFIFLEMKIIARIFIRRERLIVALEQWTLDIFRLVAFRLNV